jgi:hypothetical protein
LLVPTLAFAAALAVPALPASGHMSSFVDQLPHQKRIASTVPGNGDVNPYGVAVVPDSTGRLVRGQVLVSNFNNKANLQGTGTTIVEISPDGHRRVFATVDASKLPGPCPGGVGLTTALAVLPGGWVVVGSLPTTDGTGATAMAGCLIVLNHNGRVAETWSGPRINGPWDLTSVSTRHGAVLFVSNVLNGTVAANGATVNRGTITRIEVGLDGDDMPRARSITVIGSGFGEHTDPAALVVGPTGLGLGANDVLYVADTVGNRIAAIPRALERDSASHRGRTVTVGGSLSSPLGLAIAPNGNVLTVNGGDGNLVETTPSGFQVTTRMLDSSGSPPGAGALFGLAVAPQGRGLYFVDDADNTLNLLFGHG